jgi:hypothetical protein
MQRRAYHALGRDEQCSFPAKIMSRLCLKWVKSGGPAQRCSSSGLPSLADVLRSQHLLRLGATNGHGH